MATIDGEDLGGVRMEDLRFDVYRIGRASTVRVTHLPTGVVGECSDFAFEQTNRRTALTRLSGALAARSNQ